MDQPNDFELAVISLILQREAHGSSELLEQVSRLEVSSREYTEVGFFTEFNPSSKQLLGTIVPKLPLGTTVTAKIPDLKYDMGFALYVTDFGISMLEGYTYGEAWSHSTTDFELL